MPPPSENHERSYSLFSGTFAASSQASAAPARIAARVAGLRQPTARRGAPAVLPDVALTWGFTSWSAYLSDDVNANCQMSSGRTVNLIENLLRPLGLHDAGLADPNQQVAKSVGVEHTRVVDHYECHRSVQPQLLVESREFVSGALAPAVVFAQVVHDVLKEDAAVPTDKPERDLSAFQQPDEERA